MLNGRVVLDTTSTLYVPEGERYPQYCIPITGVDPVGAFRVGRRRRLVREDEQVFVHPGTPYTRVSALGSARQLLPIAGLVAFYNEKVDIVLDGQRLARPAAHFS